MGRKSDAKQRILNSAVALMHERGYSSIGVEDIMQRAGVGKSSFYHFFPSKEAMGAAAIDYYSELSESNLFSKAFSESIDPLDRPLRLIQMICDDEMPVLGCLGGNSAAENSTTSELIRLKTEDFLARMRNHFSTAYNEAVDEMDLHPDTPVESLADASVAYVQGLLLLCRARKSWEPLRDFGPMLQNLWHPHRVS
ncbi:MAG: TetR/AcrR family transcriptional regulator [Fimbriimonadales bacterium]